MAKDPQANRHLWNMRIIKFLFTGVTGFIIAMVGFVVSKLLDAINEWKWETIISLMEDQDPAAAYFSMIGICCLLSGAAAVIVLYMAPLSRGSGVPIVLAYLNGTNLEEHFDFRTVSLKIATLVLTIAAGLTLGMEGPFVFIGGGVAMIMAKFLPSFVLKTEYKSMMKTIAEERNFMSGGVAAGLAVAFSAPIAGVLFAMEGVTAFLTTPTVLRIFASALFASFFSDLVGRTCADCIPHYRARVGG